MVFSANSSLTDFALSERSRRTICSRCFLVKRYFFSISIGIDRCFSFGRTENPLHPNFICGRTQEVSALCGCLQFGVPSLSGTFECTPIRLKAVLRTLI